MTDNHRKPALIEFTEPGASESIREVGIYRPDTVLVNGMPLLIEKGSVEIRGAADGDVVRVTMSILARQVVIGERVM